MTLLLATTKVNWPKSQSDSQRVKDLETLSSFQAIGQTDTEILRKCVSIFVVNTVALLLPTLIYTLSMETCYGNRAIKVK